MRIVVAGAGDVARVAAKVGLPPNLVHQAVSALAQAHVQPGDTVQGAANATGLPQQTLQEILGHLGGEGWLAEIAGGLFNQRA